MAIVLGVAAALGGCLGRGTHEAKPPAFAGPVPTSAELAERYNAHVRGLEQLQARVSLVIDAPDGKGGTRHDQVEGDLMVVPPRKVSLRIEKVSQPLAILGSNDERYWWFDLSGENQGYTGLHERATASSAAEFGVPVLPVDLVQLLAITPLPVAGTRVELHENGGWLVATLPAAGTHGTTRLTIDPATYRAVRVDVLDASGTPLVWSVPSRYVQVQVAGDVLSPARMASRYDIELSELGAKVVIGVASPENRGAKMKMGAFSYDAVRDAYGVDDIRDLDARERP